MTPFKIGFTVASISLAGNFPAIKLLLTSMAIAIKKQLLF